MKNIWKWIIGLVILLLVVFGIYFLKNQKGEGEEDLIGGCAGVSLENLQECCDNWAEENEIVRIQCVGEWEIVGGECSWKCGTFEG